MLDAEPIATILGRTSLFLAQAFATVAMAQVVALGDTLAALDLAILGRTIAVRMLATKRSSRLGWTHDRVGRTSIGP